MKKDEERETCTARISPFLGKCGYMNLTHLSYMRKKYIS